MSNFSYPWVKLPLAIVATAIFLPALFYLMVWVFLDSETLMTYNRDMIIWKSRPLQIEGRDAAIIILGGSGGLYSFETPLLEQKGSRPAINFATQWGVSFIAAEIAAEFIIPNDIVVMPLEYDLYDEGAAGDISYVESCYLVSQARHLMTTNWQRFMAVTGCDIKLAIYGMFIKALRIAGRADPVNDMGLYLNVHGDIVENLAGKNLIKIPFSTLKEMSTDKPFCFPRLEKLAKKIQDKGGVFVVTFPAYPMQYDGHSAISDEWVVRLKEWAIKYNIYLVSTPLAHSFPPDCFFDSPYHLHRGCTRAHTEILYESLKQFLQ